MYVCGIVPQLLRARAAGVFDEVQAYFTTRKAQTLVAEAIASDARDTDGNAVISVYTRIVFLLRSSTDPAGKTKSVFCVGVRVCVRARVRADSFSHSVSLFDHTP